jgi:hypothetical protein
MLQFTKEHDFLTYSVLWKCTCVNCVQPSRQLTRYPFPPKLWLGPEALQAPPAAPPVAAPWARPPLNGPPPNRLRSPLRRPPWGFPAVSMARPQRRTTFENCFICVVRWKNLLSVLGLLGLVQAPTMQQSIPENKKLNFTLYDVRKLFCLWDILTKKCVRSSLETIL